ncbi:MAG TPA: phosphoribosylformylglycinamidine synthase II, partial [Aquifex aeolicus]|nr:phosphoribosylformylglycinamidine synthase II [Aquifex aeolicus]
GLIKGDVPAVDLEKEKALIKLLLELNEKKLILCAHDVSTGGLIITLLEMVFSSRYGLELEFYSEERADVFLFSENPTRVVVSVENERSEEFKELVESKGLNWLYLGKTTEERIIKLNYNGEEILNYDIERLKKLWKKSFARLVEST